MVNWKSQTMAFNWKSREVILVRDPALKCSKVSIKGLTNALKKGKHGILIECNGICVADEKKKKTIPPFLLNEVAKYPEVLQPITQLPPHWPPNHAITLKEGSNPVSLRPY